MTSIRLAVRHLLTSSSSVPSTSPPSSSIRLQRREREVRIRPSLHFVASFAWIRPFLAPDVFPHPRSGNTHASHRPRRLLRLPGPRWLPPPWPAPAPPAAQAKTSTVPETVFFSYFSSLPDFPPRLILSSIHLVSRVYFGQGQTQGCLDFSTFPYSSPTFPYSFLSQPL